MAPYPNLAASILRRNLSRFSDERKGLALDIPAQRTRMFGQRRGAAAIPAVARGQFQIAAALSWAEESPSHAILDSAAHGVSSSLMPPIGGPIAIRSDARSTSSFFSAASTRDLRQPMFEAM